MFKLIDLDIRSFKDRACDSFSMWENNAKPRQQCPLVKTEHMRCVCWLINRGEEKQQPLRSLSLQSWKKNTLKINQILVCDRKFSEGSCICVHWQPESLSRQGGWETGDVDGVQLQAGGTDSQSCHPLCWGWGAALRQAWQWMSFLKLTESGHVSRGSSLSDWLLPFVYLCDWGSRFWCGSMNGSLPKMLPYWHIGMSTSVNVNYLWHSRHHIYLL